VPTAPSAGISSATELAASEEAAQNTVVLPSEMVSRTHAMIQKNEAGGYSVFDLGSRNGTAGGW
jgi:hypothetical protein